MHLKGLSAAGLAAALLACRGITKVKLQPIYRSFLPCRFFEHLEARGCKFEWRQKVLQVCPCSQALIPDCNHHSA